jgi:hypothetical protein
MPSDPGTLELIASQIGLALAPLEAQLTPTNIIPFLAELGVQFPPALTSQSGFMTQVNTVATAAGALPAQLTKLASDITAGDDAAIVQDGITLVGQIKTIISAIEAMAQALSDAASSITGIDSGAVTSFAGTLATNLLSYLIITYAESVEPGYVGFANLLGIVNYVRQPGVSGDPTQPPYTQKQLSLSNLQQLFTNPVSLMETLYAWGSPTFDGTQMMPRLGISCDLLGLPALVPNPPGNTLTAPLLTLQANPATTPPGVLATFTYGLPGTYNFTIPVSQRFAVQIQLQGSFGANLQVTATPPATVTLSLPTATLNGSLQTALVGSGTDATHPLLILGSAGSSRMEAQTFSVGAGLTLTASSTGSGSADPTLQAAVTGGNVVIDTTNSDGFIADILGPVHVEAPFQITATWRMGTGLHITGGAQLEIDLPLHLTLGPVTVPTLYLIGGVGSNGITLEVSVALGVSLGPVQVAVDRLGAVGTLSFPSQGGNLGPADIQVAFKPPNGLGIAIDAAAVVGGGYISFDPTKGQYAGVLQLALLNEIQITAIAILDTVMPDGSSGYSFLFIITFTLPPIQLGLGFTLNGVGGLGGVNRTMDLNALQAGFRAHTLGSIMFPSDPIDNAPAIIKNIEAIFPPAQGRYLFGPLLEIGWGTPTLVTFTIGLILSLPDPITLALLGLIDAGLPTQDEALVELHIEVLGVVDFAAQTVSIDGQLYNSRILAFALNGALALRFSAASPRNLLFSLGGFNPHFDTTGLNVPQLTRLSISIGDGDNPRLSASSYLAVTSNTRQFGANVELTAHAGGFGVRGYLGYDLLIVPSPFSFEFDFTASLDVTYDGDTLLGLSVSGIFSGPTPWHVHAEVTISLLFFSVSATIDRSFGDSTQISLPAIPVLPDLIAALQDARSWSAALPAGASVAVSLVAPAPGATTLSVHPLGSLTVKETVVPLDLPITRYGSAAPADGSEFSIGSVTIGGQVETTQPIQDYFAPGQFLTLTDDQKLSLPSFEPYDAGVTIGSAAVLSGPDVTRSVMYEEIYIDDPATNARLTGYYNMPATIHAALSAQGAGAQSSMKHTGLVKYAAAPATAAITLGQPAYVVASAIDLSVRADIVPAAGSSYFVARAALLDYLATSPTEIDALQVLPVWEVAA